MTYIYNASGNLVSVQKNGEVIKSYTYGDASWKDLLTAFNGQTITYDEIGNPLQYRDGMSFTWDKGRQLQSVTKNGVTTSYTYDENGLRLSKTTGGVTTKIYRTNGQMVGMNSSDGKDLMFLLDGSGNVYELFFRALYYPVLAAFFVSILEKSQMHTWVYLLFALLFCAKGYLFCMETQQKSKVLFWSII